MQSLAKLYVCTGLNFSKILLLWFTCYLSLSFLIFKTNEIRYIVSLVVLIIVGYSDIR